MKFSFQTFKANLRSGDIVSPMLVKEIRQGMKTKTFVAIFLLVQTLMIFAAVISLLGAGAVEDSNDLVEIGTVLFWSMVSIPLCLAMPARGMNAVGSEIRAGTLELLYLTRLSAWRIVFGKWFSLFAQTLLLLTAMLPYAVLRYFLGGVNIVEELLAIGLLLLFSGAITAATVGLSAFPGFVMRGAMSLAGFFGLISFVGILSGGSRMLSFGAAAGSTPFFEWALVVFEVILFAYIVLEFGAAAIAPPAENHALRKRFAAFLVLVCTVVFMQIDYTPMVILGFIAMFLISIFALLEKPVYISTPYAWNATKPAILRPFFRNFYPGWPFAIYFTLFMGLGCFLVLLPEMDDEKSLLVFISFLGSIFWTTLVIHCVPGFAKRPVAGFIAVQIFGALLAGLFSAIQEAGAKMAGIWLFPVPPAVFWQAFTDSTPNNMEFTMVWASGVLLVFSLVILWLRSRSAVKQVLELERVVRERRVAL